MMDDRTRVVFGFRPRTPRGWAFWFVYWSPVARWWRRVRPR